MTQAAAFLLFCPRPFQAVGSDIQVHLFKMNYRDDYIITAQKVDWIQYGNYGEHTGM